MDLIRSLVVLLPITAAGAQADPDAGRGLHAPFDALLRAHVRGERVDYLTLRDRDLADLDRYLDRLAAVDPAQLTRDARLAFYLNLYNATMLTVIARRIDADYGTSDANWGVFDEKLVRLGGEQISLNHLEHEIVRKRFGDPRIHAALVCGAVSCPPLLPRAYEAEDIDEILEDNMTRFVNDPKRNRLERDELELSKLFEWFAEDFGGEESVPAYVARYARSPGLAKRPVTFIEYSWALNIAPPASGRWVRVVVPTTELEANSICEVLEQDGERLRVRLPLARGEAWVEESATTPWADEQAR